MTESGGKPWKCGHCNKAFIDANAVFMHHKKKHFGKKLSREVKAARASAKNEDESFASRAIQAELDHAMGIDNYDYDWLVAPYK